MRTSAGIACRVSQSETVTCSHMQNAMTMTAPTASMLMRMPTQCHNGFCLCLKKCRMRIT